MKIATLIVIAVFLCLPIASGLDEATVPAELYAVSVSIGNCSGTVVPPVQDTKGNWHWLVLTAGHCVRTNELRRVEVLYPPDVRATYDGRVVVDDNVSDVAVIEFTPPQALPYVALAPVADLPDGSQVYTCGYPGMRGLFGMSTSVIRNPFTKPRVAVKGWVEHGHSGGGLFADGKLVGVASEHDNHRDKGFSLFSHPSDTHRVYHQAAEKLGAKPDD